MVMCNSPWGFWKTCVACMDGQQSHEGTICCDTAEDLDFQEEDILKQCEYAKESSINNVEFEIRQKNSVNPMTAGGMRTGCRQVSKAPLTTSFPG